MLLVVLLLLLPLLFLGWMQELQQRPDSSEVPLGEGPRGQHRLMLRPLLCSALQELSKHKRTSIVISLGSSKRREKMLFDVFIHSQVSFCSITGLSKHSHGPKHVISEPQAGEQRPANGNRCIPVLANGITSVPGLGPMGSPRV